MMRKNILALCLIISALGHAQSTSFFRSINNDSADVSADAFQRDNGDYFLLSNTNRSGHSDFQVTKTNGLGIVLWSFTYGTTSDDVATAMAPTSDNGMVICGYSDGFSTSIDAFITKISSAGVLEWTRAVRTDSVEKFLDVAVSINGDIYATGFVDQDTMDLNILVARFSNTGTFLWAKHFGGIGEDIGHGVIEDQRGRVIVVGGTKNDSITLGASGDQDICVLALNSGGTLLNQKNLGTVNKEYAKTIVQESANRYIVAGNIDRGIGGSFDGFLAALDTNFSVSTAVYFGVPGSDDVEDIKSLGNNRWMVASLSESAMGTMTSLLFEVSTVGGVPPALSVGGTMDDGRGRLAITGRQSTGYALFSAGKSFGSTTSDNLYLAKSTLQNTISCLPGVESMDFGSLTFISDTFTTSNNSLIVNNAVALTRTSVTNSDTTFCCRLAARVSADTITICQGEVASLGRSSVSGYQYAWTATGYTSANANPSVSPANSILYKLVVTSADGLCTADSAEIFVRVNPRRSIPPLNDTTFCIGSSITLTAPSNMNFYEWSGTSGRTSGATRILTTSDTLSLRLIDNNGCAYFDTLSVLRKELPLFSLGNDTTICENLSLTLSGPADMDEYKWNGVSSSDRTFVTNVSQTHVLSVIDTFGCEFEDEIRVLTNPNSPLDLGPDSTVCEGGAVVFFGNSVLTRYTWNGVQTNNYEFTATTAGIYAAVAYNSFDCPSYDTVELFVVPLPQFSLGNDTGACDEIALQLRGPLGMKKYTWFNGSVNQAFNVNAAGLYYLQIESQQGCLFTDSIVIAVYSSPSISLGEDTSLRTQDPLILTPGTGFQTYLWSTGESTESISVKDKGVYSVTVTDSNGCAGFDEMEILSAASTKSLRGINVSVYPNPVSNTLHIKTSGYTLKGKIQLVDNQGGIVIQEEMSGASQLDVSGVSAGLYRLVLSTENGSIGFNVVIKR